MKNLVKILVVVSLVFGAVACGGKKEEAKDKVYTVGTNAEYMPFEYLDNNEIKGLDVEIIEMISQKTGLKFQWKNMNFDGLIPALQTGKVDVVIAGMSITPEREKAVSFSTPYLASNVSFLANKENMLDNLDNKTFGAELGTTKEATARSLEGSKVVPFSSSTGALVALKSKKIDALVLDESVAKSFASNNPDLYVAYVLVGEPKAIAFNKKDEELKEIFNTALKELIESGEIDKLKEKYGV